MKLLIINASPNKEEGYTHRTTEHIRSAFVKHGDHQVEQLGSLLAEFELHKTRLGVVRTQKERLRLDILGRSGRITRSNEKILHITPRAQK